MPAIYSEGTDLAGELAKALRFDRPIFGITIHVECESVARVDISFPIEVDDIGPILKVMRRYRLVPEPDGDDTAA